MVSLKRLFNPQTKKHRFTAFLSAVCLLMWLLAVPLVAAEAASAALPTTPPEAPQPPSPPQVQPYKDKGETLLFPLEALTPGQQGYAVTADVGNVLTRFPIEVLALQYDLGTGFPLVLVQARGELIGRVGGIAAGMSGSPVYLPLAGEDALLGAIGFTFPGSDGGLALVTPIETMRQAEPSPLESAPEAFGPTFDASEAVPVRTPLLLAGLSGRAAEMLAPLFGGQTLPTPLQVPTRLQLQSSGTSTASATASPPNPYAADDRAFLLAPGSAVSVQLVRGDVTVAAVGTLTLLEGERFWAFGHPLLGQGAVSFALAPAYVSAIVPSRELPFKLADSGRRVLGRVTQDRPYALGGLLGGASDFIPVTLTLQRGAARVTKRFEVAGDERVSTALLASASLQALDDLLAETSGGTAELAWELRLRGGRTVRLLEQTIDSGDVAFAAATLAAAPLGLLADNPFQTAQIERLELNITLEPNVRVAEVAEVVLAQETLPSGGALDVNVRLQPFRAEPEVKTVRVRLPETLSGPVELTVRGGLTPALAPGGAPGDGAENEGTPLFSFAELLSALETRVQARELVIETPVDGEVQILARLLLPYLVSGSETRTVQVENGAGERPPRSADGPEGPPRDLPIDPAPPPDELPDELPGDGPPQEPPPPPAPLVGGGR